MEDLDEQIEDAKAAGDEKLKKALKQQYVSFPLPQPPRSLPPNHYSLTPLSVLTRRELHLIKARNAHVTRGLQAAYAAKAPDGRLDVFCVSNKWYAKYSRKDNAEGVRASGIPALRRFCYSITADAQLREARHFLVARVFGLVNSVELWVGGRLRLAQAQAQARGGGRAQVRAFRGQGRGGVRAVREVLGGLVSKSVFTVGFFSVFGPFTVCACRMS
jgi:hypothetical protein